MKVNNASLCNGKRFHQSALEESTVISYTTVLRGQAAELYSLTPWKGSSEHSDDWRHCPSSSSTGISSYTFHTSARTDPSCHGSAFCSTSEMLEQRHTDSSTDRWGWSWLQGPGSTLCLHCWCVLAPQPIISCAAWKQRNSQKGCQM